MTTAKLDLTVMETTEGPELPFYLDELIIIGQWETGLWSHLDILCPLRGARDHL